MLAFVSDHHLPGPSLIMAAVSTSRARRLRDAATKRRLFCESTRPGLDVDNVRVQLLVNSVEQLTISLHTFLSATWFPGQFWQDAPIAFDDFSSPPGNIDGSFSYSSPLNASVSKAAPEVETLLGLLHSIPEEVVTASMKSTSAVGIPKVLKWEPSTSDLFVEGSKLRAELADEAATVIQQAFRNVSRRKASPAESRPDPEQCDVCGQDASDYNDTMMNCGGSGCFSLCHYECLSCTAVTAWQEFANDGGKGAHTWLCRQCRHTGNTLSDGSEKDDSSSAQEDSKSDHYNASPHVVSSGWPDLDTQQQVAFQAWLREREGGRRDVRMTGLKHVLEELEYAESRGDLDKARSKLEQAKALEATAEEPMTSEDMRRESWLFMATTEERASASY